MKVDTSPFDKKFFRTLLQDHKWLVYDAISFEHDFENSQDQYAGAKFEEVPSLESI